MGDEVVYPECEEAFSHDGYNEDDPQLVAHLQQPARREAQLEDGEPEGEEEDDEDEVEGETCEYCGAPAFSQPESDLFLCEDCDADRDDSFFKNASEW